MADQLVHEFTIVSLGRSEGILPDKSNGYEAIAEAFVRARSASIGPKTVRNWARRLPPGSDILDLGCGHGVPVSEALIHDGFTVYGVDASKTLVAIFRERFPDATVECSSVEESLFFSRTFDAILAWGLIFLLLPHTQRSLIGKVSRALNPNGHFLFTSPRQACSWVDSMTGFPSYSLGHTVYEQELSANGLTLVGTDEDEGQNYYYLAARL
jgi:2-polyprenyl-3-methyl-5-hydroxy-6-metoxy-1,4-benzoquinol methylase